MIREDREIPNHTGCDELSRVVLRPSFERPRRVRIPILGMRAREVAEVNGDGSRDRRQAGHRISSIDRLELMEHNLSYHGQLMFEN